MKWRLIPGNQILGGWRNFPWNLDWSPAWLLGTIATSRVSFMASCCNDVFCLTAKNLSLTGLSLIVVILRLGESDESERIREVKRKRKSTKEQKYKSTGFKLQTWTRWGASLAPGFINNCYLSIENGFLIVIPFMIWLLDRSSDKMVLAPPSIAEAIIIESQNELLCTLSINALKM